MGFEGHNSKCISCSHFPPTFLSNLGESKFVGLDGKSPTPFSSPPFSLLNQTMETPIFPSIFPPTFPSSLYWSNPNPQTNIAQVKSSFVKLICLLCKFLLDSYYYHSTRTCDIFHLIECFNLMTQFHL